MKRLKMEPIERRRQSELETVPPTFRLDFVTAVARESGRGASGLMDFVRHICSRAL